jgi:MATE family multidrug resistance protein
MNLANLACNTVLIFGDDGLEAVGLPRIGMPALGVLGSGLASSLASVVGLFVVFFRGVVKQAGLPTRADLRADPATQREIWRLGMPISMHLIAEVGAFSVAGIFAGWLGPQAAAGHQVALGLASLSFTMALGMSNATSILVGRAVGRGDTPGARRAGLLGIAAGTIAMGCSAIVFAVAPHACARILTDKPDILEAAVPLIRIAAVFQLADAVQSVASGALRGAGDTRSARNANMFGYYALGLPLSLLLGFGFHLGAVGIWWGLTVALFVVAIVLLYRFYRLSSGEIRRV